jgi:hypothetical protein
MRRATLLVADGTRASSRRPCRGWRQARPVRISRAAAPHLMTIIAFEYGTLFAGRTPTEDPTTLRFRLIASSLATAVIVFGGGCSSRPDPAGGCAAQQQTLVSFTDGVSNALFVGDTLQYVRSHRRRTHCLSQAVGLAHRFGHVLVVAQLPAKDSLETDVGCIRSIVQTAAAGDGRVAACRIVVSQGLIISTTAKGDVQVQIVTMTGVGRECV